MSLLWYRLLPMDFDSRTPGTPQVQTCANKEIAAEVKS
jgi:hypothetical protein